jgi:hypothetical protein
LLGDTPPLALDACGGIDCLRTCIIDFCIECVAFYHGMPTLCGERYGVYEHIRAKLPLQTVMGQVPVLEYMLSGARRLLRSCLILIG